MGSSLISDVCLGSGNGNTGIFLSVVVEVLSLYPLTWGLRPSLLAAASFSCVYPPLLCLPHSRNPCFPGHVQMTTSSLQRPLLFSLSPTHQASVLSNWAALPICHSDFIHNFVSSSVTPSLTLLGRMNQPGPPLRSHSPLLSLSHT